MKAAVGTSLAIGWQHDPPEVIRNGGRKPFMSFRVGGTIELAVSVPEPLADKLNTDELKNKLAAALRAALEDWKAGLT